MRDNSLLGFTTPPELCGRHIFYYLLMTNTVLIVSPITAVALQLIVLFISRLSSKLLYINFIASIIILLSLINTTKAPVTDLINYVDWFSIATSTDFFDYIWIKGKEPAYFAFSYLISNIFGNTKEVLVTWVTITGYIIILYSIYRFGMAINLEPEMILATIVFIALFPQLFSISAHLIRQFLAGALFLLFVVGMVIDGKKRWWVLFVAFLTHTSIGLLIILFFIPGMNKPISMMRFFYVMFLVVALSLTIRYLAQNFTSDQMVLSYAMQRAGAQQYFQLSKLGLISYFLIVTTLAIGHYTASKKISISNNFDTSSYYLMSNISIFISLFVLLTSLDPAYSELSKRYFFYLYYFFPFLLMVAVCKKSYVKMLSLLLIFIIPAYFFIKIETGIFIYTDYLDIILY